MITLSNHNKVSVSLFYSVKIVFLDFFFCEFRASFALNEFSGDKLEL